MSKKSETEKSQAATPDKDATAQAGNTANTGKNGEIDESGETAAGTPWAGGAEAAAAQAEADEVAALRAETDKLKDQLLRALAEMENLRQRTQRELADARTYATANFARDMLSVSDNLRRALDALPEDTGDSDPTLKTLREGVEMTERSLQQTLEKHQVRLLDPAGERFDPNFHQAMFEVEDASVPAGTVVQVAQAGYTIGERVLRPAMVGVAKGGPKPEKPAAAAQKQGEPEPEVTPDTAPEASGPHDAAAETGEQPSGNGRVGARVDKSA